MQIAFSPQGDGSHGDGLSKTIGMGFVLHSISGSPVKPGKQKQLGVWLTTRHSVLTPQEPGQGSLHFLFMQAKLNEHSLLVTHSGLQLGGTPLKSGKQEQDGDSPITLHTEFGPQGEGSHGFTGFVSSKIAVNGKH